MSVAKDARAEFERMIRVGDDMILAGSAPGLLQGPQATDAQAVAASYRHTVEQLEASEGLHWDGVRHLPLKR